jgi:hypothetical protein
MSGRFRTQHPETYEEMRARILAETSAYITECLRHPELAVHIPIAPASEANFPPSLSAAFWNRILND